MALYGRVYQLRDPLKLTEWSISIEISFGKTEMEYML